MLRKLKNGLRKHSMNVRGWRTGRKIVVIESDDWGAIRLPGAELLEKIKGWGIKMDKDPMLRNDALASKEDLQRLFETLQNIPVKRKPIITANTIVANPDFERIEAGGFQRYFFEPFTKTLRKYPSHQGAFDLWKSGMVEKLFHPQFHGREHLQVNRWMYGLQKRDSETARLFYEKIYAVCGTASTEKRRSYLAAYDWDTEEDRELIVESIQQGLELFESLFGYRSKSAIAPNYVWSSDLERVYAENGVKYLQGALLQRSPQTGPEKSKLIRHYMGEVNNHNQRYLIRNCRFEPSLDKESDTVADCLKQISTAFLWKKPAVIVSHRVNYIGYIDPKNRESNLGKLDDLLRRIVKRWPDVEFMTSDQLGDMME